MSDTNIPENRDGGPLLGLGSSEGLGPDADRVAFEAWFGAPAHGLDRLGDGYRLSSANAAWNAWKGGVQWERDCRTCTHHAPHHYGKMLHCCAPLRCVAGGSYKRVGGVQLWEAAAVTPSPF